MMVPIDTEATTMAHSWETLYLDDARRFGTSKKSPILAPNRVFCPELFTEIFLCAKPGISVELQN